ncbi:hypothetical protein PYCCODRAFT_1470329 [Trametes coccinea BRFM310]|uniref:Protein-S-isoprenylcysteine O-methyltransferase n=1 Tax=Trametes coccinea (strain BRFM310) TaxID=1353009 RepID=A0A1Y2IDP6_TRAC3|nr:hypothetical protein PYCCODRAFT_1470329 [Trametes coccinea BRFM310]
MVLAATVGFPKTREGPSGAVAFLVNETELIFTEHFSKMNWLVALKVPTLAMATIAGYVNCSAPNPPPSRQDAAKLENWGHSSAVALVIWGRYAIVRHPSHTGFYLATIGMLVTEFAPGGWLRESGVLETSWGKAMMAAWAANVSMVTLLVLRRIPKEDAMMKKEFGDEWENWSEEPPTLGEAERSNSIVVGLTWGSLG